MPTDTAATPDGLKAAIATVRCGLPDDPRIAPELLLGRVLAGLISAPGDAILAGLLRLGGPEAILQLALGGHERVFERIDPAIPRSELEDALRRWRPTERLEELHRALGIAADHGIRLLVPEDGPRLWPARLYDLSPDERPAVLWHRGRLEAVDDLNGAIAIVGSRACTEYGSLVADQMARGVVADEVVVISGGAYGIDTAAHRAALAAGGITVAVLAGGIDDPYPSGNRLMFERMLERGALLSEVAPGRRPTRRAFIERNRLIAAIAGTLLVVEAGARSGSMSAARSAAWLRRNVGAVPGRITSAASTGCHALLSTGGAVLIDSPGTLIRLHREQQPRGAGADRDTRRDVP